MKKYTILDNKGKKTIVYAKDIAHALPYAKDSRKIKDESITIEGDWNYEGIQAAKFMGLKFAYTGRRVNGYPEAKISGDKQKLIKYMKEWYDPDFFKEGFKGFDSKVKDANLNIIDKLIAEEEKAVMDYKEALMADSDSFADSVYTHILDEELDHLRELRSLKEQSVSDGNAVEKKLDDSIHDGLSEAKDLVKQAGFKVVRAYGTDNEPYITVDWSGSYSELQKRVRELKSKAKAIGYKTVYADDNDICFSKY